MIDPAGSCAQIVPHREWEGTDASKLLRALSRIGGAGVDKLAGVRIASGNAIATDGHRLLCVVDYCRAEHIQGHTYTIAGSGFGLFGVATTEQDYLAWESTVPKLRDVRHSLQIAFRSIPRVSDYTPVSLSDGGIALGCDPDSLVTVDLRYLGALPRTDSAFRALVVDAGKEKESLVIPLEVPHG